MKRSSLPSEDTPRQIFDELQMLEELTGESERACAIVGVAYLDDLLLQLLKQYLVENVDGYHDLLDPGNANAVLSSFGARIIMAGAIGIVSQTDVKVLRKLKDIRNRFAHKMDMTFTDPKILSLIQGLKDLLPKEIFIRDSYTPCEIFVMAAGYCSGQFSARLRIMKEHGITGGFSTVLKLFMSKADISSLTETAS
jgi:hypothetical protein